MKTTIIGKTDSTLTLNKCKAYIRGKSEVIIDVVTDEQKMELAVLEREGLIVVIDGDDADDVQINAPRTISDQERIFKAEAETQKMGSKAVISTGDGTQERRMVHYAADDVVESDATKDSIEALKKLEEEENAVDLVINEETLDDSQQMGRDATISTGAITKKVGLVNSIIPESKSIKKSDPFIDREEKQVDIKKESSQKPPSVKKEETIELSDDDLFIGSDSPTNDNEDPFIEI